MFHHHAKQLCASALAFALCALTAHAQTAPKMEMTTAIPEGIATPVTRSVYMTAWLEMTDEPWVIETPPNVLGFIDPAGKEGNWLQTIPGKG
jgi:hypothetical protein